MVLTSPQSLAKIISLPQPGIALILLDMIPVNGGMNSKPADSTEHYAYIDLNDVIWDRSHSFWRPRGTVGSRVSVRYLNELELTNMQQHLSKPTAEIHTKEINISIPTTQQPDISIVSNSAADELINIGPRPPSQMSPISSRPTPSPIPPTRLQTVAAEGGGSGDVVTVDDEQRIEANTNNSSNGAINESVSQVFVNQMDGLTSQPVESPQPSPAPQPTVKPSPVILNFPQSQLVITPRHQLNSRPTPRPGPPLKERGKEETSQAITESEELTEYREISDDEELSLPDRDELVTQALNDQGFAASDLNLAPTNSPNCKSSLSRRSSLRSSQQPSIRQPSARIDTVYKKLKGQPAQVARAYRPTSGNSSYTVDRYDDDDMYNTSYMKQRAHEWNLRIHDPDETPGVSVKWANLWLGGGRNLHHEELEKRPSSAQLPGWREEWKEDMKETYRPHTTNSATRYSKLATMKRIGSGRRSGSSHASAYEKQLQTEVRRATHSQALGYRSSYLTSSKNMRDKKQILEMQRELVWNDYINNVILATPVR